MYHMRNIYLNGVLQLPTELRTALHNNIHVATGGSLYGDTITHDITKPLTMQLIWPINNTSMHLD